MVARNPRAHKSPAAEKPQLTSDLCRDQVERRCEDATCLARQAGPGPRM